MLGSLTAMASVVTAIATFFLEDSLVLVTLFLAGFLAVLASIWRGRPVFLLAAYVALVFGFVVQPQAFVAILATYQIELILSNILHAVVVATGALLVVGLMFYAGCRRQSGGMRLGTLETSEDLARLVSLAGNSAALLFVPLLALPVYLVATQAGQTDIAAFGPISWGGNPATATEPHMQIFVWLLAVIMLCALPAAYMQNSHHRVTPLRKKLSDNTRAWLELFGGLVILLPLCAIAVELGWGYAQDVRVYTPEAMLAPGALPVEPIPHWMLLATLPAAFLLLGCSSVSILLRSLIFLFGPDYLRKRASTHFRVLSRTERLDQKFGSPRTTQTENDKEISGEESRP